MTNATAQEHDLEDHIPMLRKLDEARKRSGELRDEGIEVLIAHRKDLLRSHMFDTALALRALVTKINQPFEKEGDQKKLLEAIFELGKDLQTLQLQDIVEHELSLLAAARVLRALVACPGAAFSKTALACYYWIARELYTTEESDWNMGGIRAAAEGYASAFVTGECVHAMLSFAEAQEKTGDFIEEVGEFIAREGHLENLELCLPELKKWVEVERNRLSLSVYVKLQLLSRHLVLPIELLNDTPPASSNFDEFANAYIAFSTSKKESEGIRKDLKNFAERFSKDHLKKIIAKVQDDFKVVSESIEKYRDQEKEKHNQANSRAIMKSESAHGIASAAVNTALKRVGAAVELLPSDPVNKELSKK